MAAVVQRAVLDPCSRKHRIPSFSPVNPGRVNMPVLSITRLA